MSELRPIGPGWEERKWLSDSDDLSRLWDLVAEGETDDALRLMRAGGDIDELEDIEDIAVFAVPDPDHADPTDRIWVKVSPVPRMTPWTDDEDDAALAPNPTPESLWRTRPRSGPRVSLLVPLARYEEILSDDSRDMSFADEVRDFLGDQSAARVLVRWRPYEQLFGTAYDMVVDPSEVDRELAAIDALAEAIERGDDVPPLVIDSRRARDPVVDGRHRAYAAARLGLRLAPIVDLAEQR